MFIFSGVLRQDLPEGAEGEDLPSDERGWDSYDSGGGFNQLESSSRNES